MKHLCVFRYWFERHEFETTDLAVAQAVVLKRRAHVLPFVRARASGILDDVGGLAGVQDAVVVVALEGPPPRYRRVDVAARQSVWRVEGYSAILLVRTETSPPHPPVRHPVAFGEVESRDQALSEHLVFDDLRNQK